MRAVDGKDKTLAVFKVLEAALNSFVPLGKRKWGNPSGYQHESEIYKVVNAGKCIWAATVEWQAADSGVINRYGLLSTLPSNSTNDTLGQVLEINLPLYFSKAFNTRLYEDGNTIEIRNYGKFTIGRRGLKRKDFFDYLRGNGFNDEIMLDEDGQEYICFFKIESMKMETRYFAERLVELTYLLKDFKNKLRTLDK